MLRRMRLLWAVRLPLTKLTFTGADDLGLSKAQLKKLKRKAENEKVILVEEEVRIQMDIDPSEGTEIGAPI